MNAIRHIRTKVFQMTQAEFAAVAGVKQYTVSRWEAGSSPTLDEMSAIRTAAKDRELAWSDEWFFAPMGTDHVAPKQSEAAA